MRGHQPAVLLALAIAGVVMLHPATTTAQNGLSRLTLTASRIEAFAEAARRRLDYLPGEVVLKFRSGTSVLGWQRALQSLRSRPPVTALRWHGQFAAFTDASEPDAELLASRLREQPEVEFAQPNYIRRQPGWYGEYRPPSLSELRRASTPRTANATPAAAPTNVPNDVDYDELQWNFNLINMPGAWAINPGGRNDVIVAVIDTGVTTMTGTLPATLWTGSRFETVSIPFAPSTDLASSRLVAPMDFAFFASGSPVLDFVGHGTHVASTIGEDTDNLMSLAGIAYRTRIMPVKACIGYWELMISRAAFGIPGFLPSESGGCTDEDITNSIYYAVDNGARVINMSFGGPDPSPSVRAALQYAVSKNVFVAVSMGNGFEDGNEPEYPAVYANEIEGVMSVGAVGKSERRAFYSSTGSHLEIVAPGGSSRDGGGADLGFVWQVDLRPPDFDPDTVVRPRFDRYVEVGFQGTSMASPHVAGVAALLMSQGELRNPKAIEAFMKASAKDLGTVGRDSQYGFGLLQARTTIRGQGISK